MDLLLYRGEAKMEIIMRPIGEVIPYEKNPRNNKAAVDLVANSIKEFGFKNPIIIDADGIVVAGHTRLKAAKKLGLKEVPTIMADDLTPEQIKAFRLADNKTAEAAEWDFDLLTEELDSIFDINMEDFGFDISLEDDDEEIVEDEFEVDLPEEPNAKLGDIYQLGKHRLMCGDSTSVSDVNKLMDGKLADMVFTDPPYGVAYSGGLKIENGKIKSNNARAIKNDELLNDDLYEFLYDVFSNLKMYTKQKAAIYVFYAHSVTRQFTNAFFDVGLKQRSIIIWHKTSGGFGDFMAQYMNAYEPCIYGSNGETVNWYGATNEKTVWDMDKEKKCDLHPTMKPIPVVARAINNSSQKNDIVLDLFGGSGSTIIACEQTNRIGYSMELDPHYIDVIINRWEEFTGEKAVLINADMDSDND